MPEIEAKTITVIRGDCGHEYSISVVGLDPETDLVCPQCGGIDHLTADQIDGIITSLNTQIRERTINVLADLIRGVPKR